MAGGQIPDRKKSAKAVAKKPLAEIEAATKVLVEDRRAAIQELFRLIMTIGALSQEERETLLIAANKAVAETITSLGFQEMALRKGFERASVGKARSGRAEKAAAWHAIAERLARASWARNPDLSARRTQELIWENFEAKRIEAGLEPVEPATVRKHLSKIAAIPEIVGTTGQ